MKYAFLIVLVVGLVGILGWRNTTREVHTNVDWYILQAFERVDKLWNQEGFWGAASHNLDNRYNEAVFLYAFVDKYYSIDNSKKIAASIKYSFQRLRSSEGGFYQDGRPSYMRTACYITAVCEAFRHNQLLLQCLEKGDGILDNLGTSLRWLASHRSENFNGNQDIAAMLASYELFLLTNLPEYRQFYEELRYHLLETFIFETSNRGYWPEAPASWSNRLHVGYLQVQAAITGYYLLLNPSDREIMGLFKLLVREYLQFLDAQKLTLDVRSSLGHYSGDQVPIQIPSVLWLACSLVGDACRTIRTDGDRILSETFLTNLALDDKVRDILLCTDVVYRFGVIKMIEEHK